MMIQPTEEQVKLLKEIRKTEDIEKKKELWGKISELSDEQYEKLKDCPFAH